MKPDCNVISTYDVIPTDDKLNRYPIIFPIYNRSLSLVVKSSAYLACLYCFLFSASTALLSDGERALSMLSAEVVDWSLDDL